MEVIAQVGFITVQPLMTMRNGVAVVVVVSIVEVWLTMVAEVRCLCVLK